MSTEVRSNSAVPSTGFEAETSAPVFLVNGPSDQTGAHYSYLLPMLSTHHKVVSIRLSAGTNTAGKLADAALQVERAVRDVPDGSSGTLIGYSTGAVVAAMAAAITPVHNLVLLAGWEKTGAHQRLLRDIWQALSATEPATMRNLVALCAFSPRYLAQKWQPASECEAPSPEIDALAEQLAEVFEDVDIAHLLPKIRAATLVVSGARDLIAPPCHGQALFSGIANACYSEVDCGHAMLVERPAELLRLITEFLWRPERYRPGTVIAAHSP